MTETYGTTWARYKTGGYHPGRLRVTTKDASLNWDAMIIAATAFYASDEYTDYDKAFGRELYDDVDEDELMLVRTITALQERIEDSRFPENLPFTYYRADLLNGNTEWEFLTTHGIGDDECGELLTYAGAVFAIHSVAEAGGVVEILALP